MRRVACIDIGTVTARLAVADVEAGCVLRLAKHSEICNLGEGVDATGRLSREAMGRVVACARGYVDAAREAKAEAVCCTAGRTAGTIVRLMDASSRADTRIFTLRFIEHFSFRGFLGLFSPLYNKCIKTPQTVAEF